LVRLRQLARLRLRAIKGLSPCGDAFHTAELPCLDFVPIIKSRETQEHDMPMRGEIAVPALRPSANASDNRDAWALIGFCLSGLAMSIYFAVTSTPFDEVSLLIIQYNLW
jgi:hypothetical protein